MRKGNFTSEAGLRRAFSVRFARIAGANAQKDDALQARSDNALKMSGLGKTPQPGIRKLLPRLFPAFAGLINGPLQCRGCSPRGHS